jgi:hypothetical protein
VHVQILKRIKEKEREKQRSSEKEKRARLQALKSDNIAEYRKHIRKRLCVYICVTVFACTNT